MKKSSLQDIRKHNANLILNSLMHQDAISRTDVAKITNLAPSTVSSLVGELLEDGILIEIAPLGSTGGRRRMQLGLNGNYGFFVVAEISRRNVTLHFYDMSLTRREQAVTRQGKLSGDDVFSEIVDAVRNIMEEKSSLSGRLMGVGLLFQDDIQASDFSVMYSTSLSSATISLHDALFTCFKVPVLEEFSLEHTLDDALSAVDRRDQKNAALLVFGKQVWVSVMLEGKLIPLRDGSASIITHMFLHEEKNGNPVGSGSMEASGTNLVPFILDDRGGKVFIQKACNAIRMICMLFSLDTIFFVGNVQKFLSPLKAELKKAMDDGTVPDIRMLDDIPATDKVNTIAGQVRDRALVS
ncbi:winged helix-turn-helix domain-containing protein [Parasphaerochaeta coccoides]|uniref:ROK family protein n=1 Tax=Parasphaerochaeta coccoides (strain ATCC BAA-1237 / DSM 17374 / SPN1) TaxID=760011 RepID=F4GLT8_PARC1|nr:winged helix-turn-helix domain-containing protein [Parasphaerochaeta coccoides]AEC02979.1 hypothetical protein Spico_1781 [Parasphaerochaeta coccoides DSM 17374]